MYGARWRRARLVFLAANPLCERCSKAGKTTAATVVNHRTPHRGDYSLFWDEGNWEAVCKPHHDSIIQSEERRGAKRVDPSNPWND
jgi:hypothetical protein